MYALVPTTDMPGSAFPDEEVDLFEYEKRLKACLQGNLAEVLGQHEAEEDSLIIELRNRAATLMNEMNDETKHQEELRLYFKQEWATIMQKICGSMGQGGLL